MSSWFDKLLEEMQRRQLEQRGGLIARQAAMEGLHVVGRQRPVGSQRAVDDEGVLAVAVALHPGRIPESYSASMRRHSAAACTRASARSVAEVGRVERIQ